MEREAICNATVEMFLVTSMAHLLSIGNAKTLCKLRFYIFAWREMCMVYHDHQLSKRNTGQNRAISLVKRHAILMLGLNQPLTASLF